MRKIKRLILHIGTGKTGSTSIQDSLGHARDVLLEYNIYYPRIRPYNHIFTFVPIFLEDPEKSFVFGRQLLASEDKTIKVQNYREAWVKEIEACDRDNFIISAEDFTLPFFKVDAVTRLKEFIEEYFERATIIAYVRHYDTLIPSQIQQDVKNSSNTKDLRDITKFFLNCPPLISYRQNLRKWIKVFGRENIVVRPFDPQVFYRGSLLSDFFHACNLPADDISIPEVVSNESIGKHAVAFLQKYNQTYPVFINGSVNPERGLSQKNHPIDLYRKLKDERFRIEMNYSPEQAQKINDEIDYVNRFFSEGYQFQHVHTQNQEVNVSTVDEIPIEFFVELINNYNRKVNNQQERFETHREQNENLREHNEYLQGENENLQEQNKNLREQNEILQAQNAYSQKIMEALRIPFFIRVINRLPFLKKVFQRTIGW